MTKKIKIELFSSNFCDRCEKAKQRIQEMLDQFSDDAIVYRELDVLEHLDYAVSLGVLTTPTIVINGELAFTGMPPIKNLKDELNKRLL